jgi:alanine racemase
MRTWVEISQRNLLHNISEIKKLLKPGVLLMSIVKSNAYGHGICEVAKILNQKSVSSVSGKSVGIDWFGVDSIDEALLLKKIGIKKPILILGYIPLNRLKEAAQNNFRFVVYNYETIRTLAKIKKLKSNNQNLTTKIHIKVETGTSRQGIGENEILDFAKFIKKFPQINIEGVYTHFANIEDTTDHSYAEKQLGKFKKIIKLLEKNGFSVPIKHTACSAAAILFPETHFNMVRLGLSQYGLWPSKETFISAKMSKQNIQLKPSLTWKTFVAQIKNIKKGTPVSYGLTEKVNRDSKIAVLPVGYWDGFDRRMSSVGNILINGKRCKILGRVCMNMCVADITDVSNVKVEDEAVIIGKQGREQITAEEFAAKIGTINYEAITRINPLIKRVMV